MRELKDWIPYKAERDIRCCDFSPMGIQLLVLRRIIKYILYRCPECHIRAHRFSTDIGNILHRLHTPQKEIEIKDQTSLQPLQSNEDVFPEPEIHVDTETRIDGERQKN